MDFLTSIGINSLIVTLIVVFSELLKKRDKKGNFKRFYTLIPFILAFLFGLLTTKPLELSIEFFQNYILYSLAYFGFSTFGYSFIKKTLKAKFLNQKVENTLSDLLNTESDKTDYNSNISNNNPDSGVSA